MKNRRGFTLVEMLGVLIILIMVFMIAFPSLTKIIKNTNENIDAATASVIKDATASFLSDKSDVYLRDDDYTYCITLADLIDSGNLTEKQIASLNDRDVIVKTTFVDKKPVYVLTDTCTVVSVDVAFDLIGESNVSFEVGNGGQYIEPGATAKNKAGETVSYTVGITDSKKQTVTYIDTTKIGIYTVKYTANIDGDDYSIERIVKVVDTTTPTITVTPTTETISITNDTYNVLSGVTATDNSGDIPKITASTNLSLGQAGTYSITYTATDSSGNKKTAKRTVIVSDATLVKITLIGEKDINVITDYVEQGATASDALGNDLTSNINKIITKDGLVVTKISGLGTFYVTYSLTKDNVIYSESRTVKITKILNGTVVYFNPVTGTKCTSGEVVSTIGTKVGCMKWYAFGDTDSNSTVVNLILNHNTTAYVRWNSTGYGGNGPDTVVTQLQTDTSGWTGVPARTDSYTLNNGGTNYTINYTNFRARLITAAEVATITGNSTFNEVTSSNNAYFYLDSNTTTQTVSGTGTSNYAWLYEYTLDCQNMGCNIGDNATRGYWTSTNIYNYIDGSWGVQWNGSLNYAWNSSSADFGIRPVITIPKTILN